MTTPVAVLNQTSIVFILLNNLDIDLPANTITIEKANTGIAVPSPNIEGSTIVDLYSIARGIRPPKNRAAEIGQNARANTIPKPSAPRYPLFFNLSCSFVRKEFRGILITISSNKNIPVTINKGPNAMYMYFCKKKDVVLIDSPANTIRVPSKE